MISTLDRANGGNAATVANVNNDLLNANSDT